ncbi:MAG: hypothetical protein A3F17_06725 [Gammaproteobacteria bacterium RIFCSPHIGHO2_12_FULL_41_15]|nr:MAG: hypothetical protein A3F17_06725 [Gammaproteobacteria bacterium RIFCSPHIGHO2_12_FULL_41_15]
MQYPFDDIDSWYLAEGAHLLALECAQLAPLLSRIHGAYLIQIGGCADLAHVSASPVFNRFSIGTHVLADWRELPFLPDSLDLVVVMHVLEYLDSPVQLLEEIHQALIPGGQLIILGFNPWSLWGLSKMFNKLRAKKAFPWKGKFWSRAQIKQWLCNYGYRIAVSKTFCFYTPTRIMTKPSSTSLVETLGQLLCPGLGDVYCVVAEKKVYALVRQPLVWWRKRAVARRRLMEPSTRA